jgi:hypothetical protein
VATRSMVLVWTDNATTEDGFVIQRKDAHCSAAGTFADLASVAANVQTYTDLVSPFPYACYRVRATLAGSGDSGYSNEAGTVLPSIGGRVRGLSRR